LQVCSRKIFETTQALADPDDQSSAGMSKIDDRSSSKSSGFFDKSVLTNPFPLLDAQAVVNQCHLVATDMRTAMALFRVACFCVRHLLSRGHLIAMTSYARIIDQADLSEADMYVGIVLYTQ